MSDVTAEGSMFAELAAVFKASRLLSTVKWTLLANYNSLSVHSVLNFDKGWFSIVTVLACICSLLTQLTFQLTCMIYYTIMD